MYKKVAPIPTSKPRARKKPATKRSAKPVRKKPSPSKKRFAFVNSPLFLMWVRRVGMGLIAILFSLIFYYFCIRPYSYRWKPCYGLQGYGVCLPHGYNIHGIDLSHHQGEIDWQQLSLTQKGPFPIRFIFLKASEGGDFSDRLFQASFDSARANGFIRGAYHFYNPKSDPVVQADFFIQSVKLQPGDLPPVLDIEVKSHDEEKLRKNLKIWLDRVEGYYGVKPILYTSYKYKMKYLNDSLFNSYPYWLAHYYVDSVRYEGKWDFWQHTDVGALPGINEWVDLNVFNGSLEELKKMTLKRVKK
ncbi:MAG: glycoside hydrolase family 25 protein [Phocaeicola sp.]